jgi:hypothetical protein
LIPSSLSHLPISYLLHSGKGIKLNISLKIDDILLTSVIVFYVAIQLQWVGA